MANQSKLKAWVRYDGTGRVISGGPIFQVNKPKVGNWKQIDANLCCNSGSTTTTTTAGGGGVTPTAFVNSYFLNGYNSCNSTTDGTILFYSSSTTLQAGVAIFTDAALTIPVEQGYVIPVQVGGAQYDRYVVGFLGVLSFVNCANQSLIEGTYLVGSNPTFTCEGSGTTMSVNVPDTGLATAAYVTGNFTTFGFVPGSSVSIRYNVGGTNYIRQFSISMSNPNIASVINNSRTC